MRNRLVIAVFLIAATTVLATGQAAAPASFDPAFVKGLAFRNLGPFRAGSWVTSFAVPDAPAHDHLYTFYVGTRNGGVWKTVNAGTTFEPVFDAQTKLSIGDVAVAPSDSDIVWVGTGEAYCARSSNPGDGIYKSTDAGKTWTNMGLRDSHHIARIVIHPTNPDVVYAAAMGHLFSPNAERGVFKTTDGGKTWSKVLFVNDKIGVVDLVLVASEPDTLYAATYDKVRLPWHYEIGGPESAIYKTTDGGRTWTRLAGGLPVGHDRPDRARRLPEEPGHPLRRGRERQSPAGHGPRKPNRTRSAARSPSGADDAATRSIAPTTPARRGARSTPATKRPWTRRPTPSTSCASIRTIPDTVYITGPIAGQHHRRRQDLERPELAFERRLPEAFGDWRCHVGRSPGFRPPDLRLATAASTSPTTGARPAIMPTTSRSSEFYAVGVDMEDPYNIYGGLQDHDSWKGPSNGWAGEISAGRLGDGRRAATACTTASTRPTAAGSTTTASWGRCGGSTRSSASRRRSRPGARPDSEPPALQLDAADRPFAAQSGDRLHRRPGPLPFPRPRRPLGGDQPRPDHEREGQTGRRRQHLLLHPHDDRRIAGPPGRHLDGQRRRQGPGDAGRRRDLARPDGEDRRGRRPGGLLGQPRLRLAPRRRNGFRGQDRAGGCDDFRPCLFKTTDFGETWTSDHGRPARGQTRQRRRPGPHAIRIFFSPAPTRASMSPSTAANRGCRSRTTCPGSRSPTWSSTRGKTTSSSRPTAAASGSPTSPRSRR